MTVIDCAHYSVDGLEQDKLGFFVPKCACGWQSPPAPDEETATDFLMQHAYEAGAVTRETPRERLWVNEERTVLVRLWASGNVEVATRPDPSAIWGPPVYLSEERP